jgi:ParB-like chromosome segregation protein Spo0J
LAKSWNKKSDDQEFVYIDVSEIYIPDKTWNNVLRDAGQIDRMRAQFESGRRHVRVILRPRFAGGYNIEDGRHRVIAAKLAGVRFIEALIVGS